eukprot:4292783-Pleurochrysis_carterae.AAC.2
MIVRIRKYCELRVSSEQRMCVAAKGQRMLTGRGRISESVTASTSTIAARFTCGQYARTHSTAVNCQRKCHNDAAPRGFALSIKSSGGHAAS